MVMVFILQKTYDMIPREVIWHILENKYVHKLYIDVIKNMHDKAVTTVRTIGGETNIFSITIDYIKSLLWVNICLLWL